MVAPWSIMESNPPLVDRIKDGLRVLAWDGPAHHAPGAAIDHVDEGVLLPEKQAHLNVALENSFSPLVFWWSQISCHPKGTRTQSLVPVCCSCDCTTAANVFMLCFPICGITN